MTLTTGLSEPFGRLDKYPALLKELVRHTPENHIDYADVQAALPLYEELLEFIHRTRKHKECELDMLNGPIEAWTGTPIKELGECQLMCVVREMMSEDAMAERYLLLFPGYLTALVAAESMSGFKLLFKCPLAEAGLQLVDTPPNGIHILAESHKLVAVVGSEEDRDALSTTWERCFQMPTNFRISHSPPYSNFRHSHSGNSLNTSPLAEGPQRHYTVGAVPTSAPIRSRNMKLSLQSPTGSSSNLLSSPGSTRSHNFPNGSMRNLAEPAEVTRVKRWSFRSMRPPPPVRPGLSVQVSSKDEARNSPVLIRKIRAQPLKRTRHRSKGDDDSLACAVLKPGGKSKEDDSILKVIEAYCVSNQAKHHMATTYGHVPVDMTIDEKDSLMFAFRNMELKMTNMEKDAQEMRLAAQETRFAQQEMRAVQQEMQASLLETTQIVRSLCDAVKQLVPTANTAATNGVSNGSLSPH